MAKQKRYDKERREEKRQSQAPQEEAQAAEVAALNLLQQENPQDVQSTTPHDHTYHKDITTKVYK